MGCIKFHFIFRRSGEHSVTPELLAIIGKNEAIILKETRDIKSYFRRLPTAGEEKEK